MSTPVLPIPTGLRGEEDGDLGGLSESEVVARRHAAELDALYRGAPVGLAFLDAELRYVRVNARMAAMNSVDAEAHVGRTPSDIMPSIGPHVERLLRQVLMTGEPIRQLEFSAEAPGEPGTYATWVINYDPVVDAAGAVVGVAGAVAEVTAIKETEAAARRAAEREAAARAEADAARARAEEADRAKSAFLATMSHELRTPLNAIGGHTQLLEMGLLGPITDAQRETLERIDRAQRHLLRLVNDVLNLSRLQAGRLDYDLRPVSLAVVVAELEPLIGPQVREKRLAYAVDVSGECVVLADREKLVQVLLNLVSNAVKFTPAGGTVTVECAERADGSGDPGTAYLRVRDTGMGIAREKLEQIFEPFVQVDTTPAGRAAGSGLGLAISRDLARGMGGDLRARSTPGVGSAFTVTLPKLTAHSS